MAKITIEIEDTEQGVEFSWSGDPEIVDGVLIVTDAQRVAVGIINEILADCCDRVAPGDLH